MTKKKFRKYFPLLTYHRGMPNEVIGAYDFLSQRGYKRQVEHVRKLLHSVQTRDRRRLIVGLIFEKGLKDDFSKECWTEEHAPFEHREKRMEKWYEDYKRDYKSKYGRLLD